MLRQQKDFIDSFIDSMLEKIKKLPEERESMDAVVNFESQLALNFLREEFEKIKQSETPFETFVGSEIEALTLTLEPIFNFFSERFDSVIGTDAMLTNTPDSNINRMFVSFAETVKEQKLYLETINNYLLEASHRYIVADDNITLINVGDCLSAAEKNKTEKLFHTESNEELSPAETERIKNHSHEALCYYEAIAFSVKHQKANISNTLINRRKDFFQCYNSDNYIVNSSYGQAGREKLVDYIVNRVNHFQRFIDAMAKLSPSKWFNFLHAIPSSVLEKYAREEITLNDTLQSKALLACLTELYLRRLDERKKEAKQPEKNKSWFGSYGKWVAKSSGFLLGSYGEHLLETGKEWVGGYSIEKKEEAVKEILLPFIISEREWNGLDDFISDDKKREECRGALFQGSLGAIIDKIKSLQVERPRQKY